jgi:hypothetical protein
MSDNKIGSIAGGQVTWPDVDIKGNPYTRPCDTVKIGGGKFVVIPFGFMDFAQIDALKPKLTPTAKVKVSP